MTELTIKMLGPFIVLKDNQPLVFSYEKVRALLAYIAAERGGAVPRARLANLLWPDQPQSAAQDSLRQAISRLRGVIDDRNTKIPFLIVERDHVQLNPKSAFSSDLSLFEQALDQVAAHRHRSLSSCAACAGQFDKAAQLVRGSFLEDLYLPDSDVYETWATALRERIKLQTLQVLKELADYAERQGHSNEALKYAARQLDIDAYNEPAHCQTMRALTHTGQRSQAAAHFQRMKQLLEEELGILPSQETLRLYEEIRQGRDLQDRSVQYVRNLPSPLSPLVGRAVELSELEVWLSDMERRLINVVGPGGVGKTRLVIQAVRRAATMFSHGAVYIPLSRVRSSGSLVSALADSLGLPASTSGDLWPQVMAYFHGRELLLVLDGFEHVLAERERISRLLEANAGLVILVTSRERLHQPGEWVFELGGLDIPPPTTPNRLEAYSSVLMFCQNARQVNQSFTLSESNRDAVGEICRLVGGVPLAIQLAAAWMHSLPVQEIANEIRRSIDFLSFRVGLEERHSSVRAVFEQSWKMLDDEERAIFSRLSVFRGGFDRPAAEAVAQARVEKLARLVDKSLLRVTAEGRYDLHDLIVQFGAEKLQESGEEETVRRRHFDYFFLQAESNEARLNQEHTFNSFVWLVRESANLREALAWATSPLPGQSAPREPELGQKLAGWMHAEIHQFGLHLINKRGHL